MDRDLLLTQRDACDTRGGIAAELAALGFEGAVQTSEGGFGVVYRCRQVALDRVVAIKVLTAGFEEDRARFLREQKAMATLTGHPHIVPVLQAGETASGHSFLVMPYCEQGSIQERIDRLGVLGVAEVLRIGVKLAGALACAHRVEIVHRDVKPANILYTDYGEPALCDFGIARTPGGFKTARGVFTGSPAFTAPEILSDAVPSAASDVYGLGASLFTALTGHAAFERRDGEKIVAQLMRIAAEPVPDLRERGIPDAAAAIVGVAMARDPADRPSAKELGQLIQRAQSQLDLPVDEMVLFSRHGSGRPTGSVASASASASASQSTGGGRLPSTVASFVGRAAEVTQLQHLLSASRLVTLIGIGGVGKTTLACHTATELRQQFSDGVWWVELAELRQGALVTEVVAATLGVRDQIGRPLTDVLVDFLGSRDTLVVLDNCEHLIGDVANLAEVLLRDCPSLRVLATSREVLDIDGEAVLRLDPLSCPALEEDPTLGTLAGYAAVQLFVQRARAAAPGFALDANNATAIARSCARLEGLPLAIELAAARMRAMSAEQIAEELADRFALLSHGRRGALGRRQSLSACVEWSYDLCTPAEQQLWRRLSVLAESFDLPTARGICGQDIPAGIFLDMLCSLVDKSILIRADHHGVVGYRLLETLRDYGKTRTTESERRELALRHAAWYHRLLASAEAEWFGPQQLHWVRRLRRDMPNVRAALQTSLTDSPPMAVAMTATLLRFWVHHAVVSEGCQWARRALDAISPEPSVHRIRALFTAAHLSLGHGDMTAAVSWTAEARKLLAIVDDPVTCGMIDFYDGYAALLTGRLDAAREYIERAIATTDDFEVQGYTTTVMSWLDLACGDARGALAWSQRCLALTEARGDWSMRARALDSSGAAHWQLGDPDSAEQALERGLKFALEIGDVYALTNGLEILAWITESRGQPRRAAILMAAAAEISRVNGAPLACALIGGFHTECERRAREQIGAEEFQTAWSEGAAMKMSDVAAAISRNSLDSLG
jgi:serine/threonine-protein kinase PknK